MTITYKGASRSDLYAAIPHTSFGDLRTAPMHPQIQGSFEYTVDNTELLDNATTNGGTVTQANSMAVVGTSTTTNSTAKLKTTRHARYKAGLGGLLRFSALFTTGVAGTEQYAGIMDATGSTSAFKNGLAVGFNGVDFGFHRFSNDTQSTVNISQWDDPLDGTGESGMIIDLTKLNVFAINYQYLGAGAIQLMVEDDETGHFIIVHTIDYTNKNTEPSTYNPNYHFTIWADNGATSSDMIIKSSSYAYFVEGNTDLTEIHQPQQSSGKKEKTTVTTEVAIFTIRNKTTYASKTNFIDILLENISASIEASSANNLGEIRLVKNATLGGSPSWSDINTTDSVVEIDTAGTTVTGGKELLSVEMAGKNDKILQKLSDFAIILADGDSVTVAASSANSATIDASLLWKELF